MLSNIVKLVFGTSNGTKYYNWLKIVFVGFRVVWWKIFIKSKLNKVYNVFNFVFILTGLSDTQYWIYCSNY